MWRVQFQVRVEEAQNECAQGFFLLFADHNPIVTLTKFQWSPIFNGLEEIAMQSLRKLQTDLFQLFLEWSEELMQMESVRPFPRFLPCC